MKKLIILAISLALFASCKKSSDNTTTPAATTPVVTPSGGTYTDLYNFNTTKGENPIGDLIISGSTLYGMTGGGGANGFGNIFSVNINGSAYTDLHDFTNSATDGAFPTADVTLYNGLLYGMTSGGGANGWGVIFSINPNGSGFQVLSSFGSGSNSGSQPTGSLVLSGNMLYGCAGGGVNGNGTIFSFNPLGNVYTDLYDITTASGVIATGTIAFSHGVFYGPAAGGTGNDGFIYAVDSNGSNFQTLITFNGTNGVEPGPYQKLVVSGTTIYGMANAGGASGNGLIFSVSTAGSGFKDLLDFTGAEGNGAAPEGSLILNGSTLYGMTAGAGGSYSAGLIFSISTSGSGFTDLWNFNSADGAFPEGGLLLSNNVLYGMAYSGGQYGWGSIFSYSL
jgi:uncharacterized repeat protein (TIGR03803 family)